MGQTSALLLCSRGGWVCIVSAAQIQAEGSNPCRSAPSRSVESSCAGPDVGNGDSPCEQQPGSLWHRLSLRCLCLQRPGLLWGSPSSGGNRNLFTLCFLAMSLWLLQLPACVSCGMLINLQGWVQRGASMPSSYPAPAILHRCSREW